jgi:alkylated DNA nucleotide flippase Atl1
MSGFDFRLAIPFIESIPRERWTSYKDVAAAAGNPKAFQAAGSHMRDFERRSPSSRSVTPPGRSSSSPDR